MTRIRQVAWHTSHGNQWQCPAHPRGTVCEDILDVEQGSLARTSTSHTETFEPRDTGKHLVAREGEPQPLKSMAHTLRKVCHNLKASVKLVKGADDGCR